MGTLTFKDIFEKNRIGRVLLYENLYLTKKKILFCFILDHLFFCCYFDHFLFKML